jgi:hypothetical protein
MELQDRLENDRINIISDDGIDHEIALLNTVLTNAFEADSNVIEELNGFQLGEDGHKRTQSSEQHSLLGSSVLSNLHVADAPTRQPLRTRGAKQSKQKRRSLSSGALSMLRIWWKEWALIAFVVGIMITITSILSIYDQQPQPKWNISLNLNTVIALLATLLRSSLVTVVEEGKHYYNGACIYSCVASHQSSQMVLAALSPPSSAPCIFR